MLKGKTYDRMKQAVQVWIPATSSAYFGLAAIWGLPGAEQVVGTLAILATFLGVTLGISSRRYEASGEGYSGRIEMVPQEEGPTIASFVLDEDINLHEKKAVTFKVVPPPNPVVLEE